MIAVLMHQLQLGFGYYKNLNVPRMICRLQPSRKLIMLLEKEFLLNER